MATGKGRQVQRKTAAATGGTKPRGRTAESKVKPRRGKAEDAAAKTRRKLVRDSFTMPEEDFALIGALKERALGFKRPTKKSELLRAGLQVLAAADDARLRAALERLVPLKPGRPRKGG